MNVIVCVGISGSGKSTWATEFMATHPDYVCINRDALRLAIVKQLKGYYQRPDLNKMERFVNACSDAIMTIARQHNSNVLIDNTNLKWNYIEPFITHHGVTNWQFKLFAIHPAIAKTRVMQRDFHGFAASGYEAQLPWDRVAYIDRQYSQYLYIKNTLTELYKEHEYQDA